MEHKAHLTVHQRILAIGRHCNMLGSKRAALEMARDVLPLLRDCFAKLGLGTGTRQQGAGVAPPLLSASREQLGQRIAPFAVLRS